MKKSILAMALTVALGGFSTLPQAAEPQPAAAGEKESLRLLRANMRMDKREFVKMAMDLGEKDSVKFWSIYHQYEAELMKLNDQRMKLIEDYAENFNSLTEDKAAKLAKAAFDLHRSRTNLLESYYKKVAKALSYKAAVRFAQIENVTNAALDLDLGAAIPLMPKD